MTFKNHIYDEKESKILEFKSTPPKFVALIKTCIAFANGNGGKIIIGIEDSSRKILGITDHDRNRVYDDFSNSLFDSVSPSLFVQIYEQRLNNESVLIIEVPLSPKKPYFLKSEGIPKGVYLRVGSSTRRATQDYIEDLIREGNRMTYDEEIVRKDVDIFTKELLQELYEKQVSKKRLLSDKIIVQSSANIEKYYPTVAGILYFTEEPDIFIPEATVTCTHFLGDEGRDIIQTQELKGPIGRLVDTSYRLVYKWLARDYKLKGTRLKASLPIPKEALREAIINALIHRKYSIPGSVKIALYENRLEIFSPGCFPGLVDLKNLGDGTTFLRNPIIARIAHRMGIVEKLGSGIRLIFDKCKKMNLKMPTFSENGDWVKVIFHFESEKDKNTSDEDAILSLAKIKGELSIKDVINHLKISRNTATRKLSILLKNDKLTRTGKGPSVRYYISSSKEKGPKT